jgi:hypothetical protein
MAYYPPIRQKLPFTIIILLIIIWILFAITTYIPSFFEYILVIRIINILFLIIMSWYTIIFKRYLHTFIFICILFSCIALEVVLANTDFSIISCIPWSMFHIMMFLLLIYFSFSYYPIRKKL